MNSLNSLKILILIVVVSLLVGIQFSTAQAELEHHVRISYNPVEHLDTIWFGINLRDWEPQSNVTINVYNNEFDTVPIAGPYYGKISDSGKLGVGAYRYDLDITKITHGKYIVVENEFHTTEGYIPKLIIDDVNYDTGCITLTGEQGKWLHIWGQLNDTLLMDPIDVTFETDTWTKCFVDGEALIGEKTWFEAEIFDIEKNTSYSFSYPDLWGSLDEPLFEAHPSLDWVMVSELPVGIDVTLVVSDPSSGDALFTRTKKTEAFGLNKLKGTAQFYLWKEIEGESLDLLPTHDITISYEGRVKQIFGQELTYDILDLEEGIISGTGPAGEVIVLEFLYYSEVPVFGPVEIQPDGTWLHEFEVTEPIPSEAWGTIEYWSPNSAGGIFVNSPNCVGTNGGVLEDATGQTEINLPPGALPSAVSITTDDLGANFFLQTDQGPAYAVYGINIGPDGTEFDIPITITMTWEDSNNDGYVDSTAGVEANLFIFKDGIPITSQCGFDPGCNRVDNTFSVQVDSLSDFVLASLPLEPSPSFVVAPHWKSVQGAYWPIGEPVTLIIKDGENLLHTDVTDVQSYGDPTIGEFYFDVPIEFLEVGNYVKVFSASHSKETIIEPVTFDYIDIEENQIGGAGPANRFGDVYINAKHWTGGGEFYTLADGTWNLNFDGMGVQLAYPMFDALVYIYDEDGDRTVARYPFPLVGVYAYPDEISEYRFYGFTDGAELTYTLYDGVEKNTVLDTGTLTVVGDTDNLTHALNIPPEPGMYFEAYDSSGKMAQIVIPTLTLNPMDTENNIISGTTEHFGEVSISYFDEFDNQTNIWAFADENGVWEADFGVEGIDFKIGFIEAWGFTFYYSQHGWYAAWLPQETIGVEGGSFESDDGTTTVDIPPGALSEPVLFTITDMGEGFLLDTDQGTAMAVYGVDIGPTGTTFAAPITITMAWEDADNDGIVDTTGQLEEALFISKDGIAITELCATDPGCNPTTNQISVQVSSLNKFVLGALSNPQIQNLIAPAEPVQVGSTVEVSANFYDADTWESYTATWIWGDGTESAGEVIDNTINGSHTFSNSGVYTLQLELFDDGGGSAVATYQYIVVYDPSGGFVTGGGWIDSPEGAYTPDPTLTGKATFGFVSKYKKGTMVPTGNTEFQFHVADLNFKSTSYDWLVVTGGEFARFKGTGAINSTGEYKFMIWAGDGETDTFRIKIWEEDEFGVETVVYDNGFDQAIGGGSIVVHTGK